MASQKTLTNDEGEVRELTERDFAQFKPFSSLPQDLQALLSSKERIIVPEPDESESKQPAA